MGEPNKDIIKQHKPFDAKEVANKALRSGLSGSAAMTI